MKSKFRIRLAVVTAVAGGTLFLLGGPAVAGGSLDSEPVEQRQRGHAKARGAASRVSDARANVSAQPQHAGALSTPLGEAGPDACYVARIVYLSLGMRIHKSM
ncbi:hypothetical protein BH20ACT22_BH20ACT22_05450 [soil metagenome]